MSSRTQAIAAVVIFGVALAAALVRAQVPAPAAPSPTPAVAASSTSAAGVPTLEGIWMLDASKSDDPRKIMEASRPPGGGGRGGEGGGGGSRGVRGGEGGAGAGWGGGRGGRRGGEGGPGGGDGERPPGDGAAGGAPSGPNPMERVMRPPQKVVVELLANEIRFSEDERGARAYALDDSLEAHSMKPAPEGDHARWKSGHLEMAQALGRRGTLVESYALSKDGRTLTIRAHREGGPPGAPSPTFTRVYTRYEGE